MLIVVGNDAAAASGRSCGKERRGARESIGTREPMSPKMPRIPVTRKPDEKHACDRVAHHPFVHGIILIDARRSINRRTLLIRHTDTVSEVGAPSPTLPPLEHN